MNKHCLQGKRLILRAPEPEDLEMMYRLENAPEMWSVSNTTVPYSHYVLRQYIANCQNDIYTDHELRLMIQPKACQQAIGTVDLIDFTPLHGRAEVGIAIEKAYQRNGYGQEALELLCDYAFNLLHVNQLYAYVQTTNAASLSLFEKCGFSQKVILKQWFNDGERGYTDAYLMQRLFTSSV